MSSFPGWEPPKENWSKLPHKLIELLPDMKLSELAVTLYLLRHTWGWGNYEDYVPMTLDEFVNGRKIGKERIDRGCGQSRQSVITGLKAGVARQTLEEEVDSRDKARIKKAYKLRSVQVRGSKSWTSGVKNLDPDLNKETSKEKDLPPPAKRAHSVRERYAEQMEKHFSKVSGIPLPDVSTAKARRAAGSRWYNPLWSIYKLFRPEEERRGEEKLTYDDQSLRSTLALIESAVKHCREENLTLAAPGSIEQTAISLFAEGGYSDKAVMDNFWEQYL